LTLSGLLPAQSYQLVVLGGEGVEGGTVTPLECSFTTEKVHLFLPLILHTSAMPQPMRLNLIFKD